MTEVTEALQRHMPTAFGDAGVELPTVKSLLVETRWQGRQLATATATLLARDQESHCALITNRHVVTGRHQNTDQPLNSNGAVPDSLTIHFHEPSVDGWCWKAVTLPLYRDTGEPFWIEHPRLGSAADVVALNLNWGHDVSRYPYYLDTTHDRVGMDVRPAEPVSVIGFPFGLSSAEKFPIWATGFLAQELSLIAAERPVFLIDCRTRAGQSGSPVIAFRAGGHRERRGDRITTTLGATATAWEFLGIYSGRVNTDSDLGRVWHVSMLGDLLDAAAADYERRAARAR